MTTLKEKIGDYLNSQSQKGLLRCRTIFDPAVPSVRFDSNDYLSLRDDKRIANAYAYAYANYPCGSGASMLLSGYHPNQHAIENTFATLLAVDECILFSSGYAANLAITALLGQINACAIIDKNVHASVYDGIALSQVSYKRFKHNEVLDLEKKLTNQDEELLPIVLTEGIFSMSGQIAPLATIAELCAKNKAALIVDEAHSFGVIGEQGTGAINFFQLSQQEVPLRVIPLGKAFATQGAIVAGQADWIQGLLQAGRSLIYSTAVSPALSYGLQKSLEVVIHANDRRLKLQELIHFFKECILHSPLEWTPSDTPIQQLRLKSPELALFYAQALQDKGFYCSAIRPPTVNMECTGLRIILNYHHTPEQITQLINQLHHIYDHTYR